MARNFPAWVARRTWPAIVACAFIALVLPAAASAATITVTSNGDATANDGNCTLREAITAANNDAPSSDAVNTCAAGSGADIIDFVTPLGGPVTPTSALPSITTQLTLDGTDTAGGCSTGTGSVSIAGGSAGTADGLALTGSSGGSTLCGLQVRTFDGDGIEVVTSGNTIAGNLIRDNSGSGVLLAGGDNNTLRGNLLGITVAGAAAPNNFGVGTTSNTQNNIIGGPGVADGNVISGNGVVGLLLSGSGVTGNRIEGNKIGTNAAGTLAVPNGSQGIRLSGDSSANSVGGDGAGEGNLISGNGSSGVQIQGADDNVLEGNFIGTDVTGTVALPNGGNGVEITQFIDGAVNNRVGGVDTSTDATGGGARNLISGNDFSAVRVQGVGTDNTDVQGNFMGTDAAGTAAIPNGAIPGFAAVAIENDLTNTLIGGSAPGAGNVISGNEEIGINVFAAVGAGTRIEGNLVGTDRTGNIPIGNGTDGVQVDGDGVSVGGNAAGEGNTIAHSGQDGIQVFGEGNPILGNSIFDNAEEGVDLFPNGITANDLSDADVGANGLQNFPELTGAQTNSVDTTVQGTLNSHPTTTFRIEFFSNPACESSGNGEGKTFLGATDVVTDGSGNAAISATLSPSVVGNDVTATATLTGTGDTSEFSSCRDIGAKAEPPAPTPPDPDPDPDPGGGSGGGGGGGGNQPPADTRPPELDVGGDGKQDSKKKVKVEVSCDEDCTVDGTGTIRVPEEYKDNGDVKSREKFDLKGADEIDLEAGDTEKLKLEFKNKAADLVEKAFKKNEKSTAKVTPSALDVAGNETTGDKFEIKVKD